MSVVNNAISYQVEQSSGVVMIDPVFTPTARQDRQMAKISVALFTPETGRHPHWAIHIKQESLPSVMWHVRKNDDETWYKHEAAWNPGESKAYMREIQVGLVSHSNVPAIRDLLGNLTIDNDDRRKDCQTYVLDALALLEKAKLVDVAGGEYMAGKQELYSMRAEAV